MSNVLFWSALVLGVVVFAVPWLMRSHPRFSVERYIEQERERYRPPQIVSDGRAEYERQQELRREEWARVGERLRADGHDMIVVRESRWTGLQCETCGESYSEKQLALYRHRPYELLTEAPLGLCTSLQGPIDGGF